MQRQGYGIWLIPLLSRPRKARRCRSRRRATVRNRPEQVPPGNVTCRIRYPMDGIRIVIFLVRCSVDLLFCDTVSTDHLRYVNTETCRGEASRLIATMQIRAASEVWMAKCRYQLIAAGAEQQWRAPTSPKIGRASWWGSVYTYVDDAG